MRREDPSELYVAPPKPNLFFVSDREQLKEYLLKLLKKYTSAGYKRENIVILSVESAGNSCLGEEDRQLAPTYLLTDTRKANCILFTTVRKFKGLEADVVICIDISANTFADEIRRSLFYVGTSRATTYLDLITLDSVENIAGAIADGKVRSHLQCIKTIREQLKVKIATKKDLEQ
jgi:superfamily I DNA/RNA helicase